MNRTGITILISTYNGELRLEQTLKSLSEINISLIPFVELILVDNASTDNTLKVGKVFWEKFGTPFPITLLSENVPGKINAQEKGLLNAKGKYIIICDDDNSLFPDYLSIGYQFLENNQNVGVLGGRGIGKSPNGFPNWFEKYSYFYGCAPQAPLTGNVQPTRNVVYGAGMWFRYDAYLKTKEFGYKFILTGRQGKKLIAGEDSELCWIIRYQNYDIWYISEMNFYHYITENRLTKEYCKRLILGMTENGLNSTIHNRIWNKIIHKKVSNFWLKELVYCMIYIVKIPFSKEIEDKQFDFRRVRNNIKVLLKERSLYDQKVNRILDYKEKCEMMLETSKERE